MHATAIAIIIAALFLLTRFIIMILPDLLLLVTFGRSFKSYSDAYRNYDLHYWLNETTVI